MPTIQHARQVDASPDGSVLPPQPPLPRAVQGLAFVTARRRMLQVLSHRYGRAFTVNLPLFGRCVIVADPELARQLFTASTDVIANIRPNLGRVLGPGSIFALDGADHRRRRKLLTPPLHGRRIRAYESVVEQEVLREIDGWPQGTEFPTLQPMMRVTLNVILRTVFGADGAELDALRRLIPPLVESGSRVAALPNLPSWVAALDPHRRFETMRAEYDTIIERLIEQARTDSHLAERDDILALMLQSTYEDGTAMSERDIADELATLLVAGHETTATTLAWAFERLSRHPDLLDALAREADGDANELRHAAILEVQRSRPVIDFAGRHVHTSVLQLGPWRIPQGCNVIVAISLLHDDSREFEDPARFDPGRFLGTTPSQSWIPFGGGTRRCIGASFAHMEMDVTLRTVLRRMRIEPSTRPGERWHSRGVAYAPRRGGRITVRRR